MTDASSVTDGEVWKSDRTVIVETGESGLKPYPHQTAAWDAMDRYYDVEDRGSGGHRAGMMVVPTGGGKTFLAANWLLRKHVSLGGRVLWLTHRRNLLKQAFSEFVKGAALAAPKETLRLISISATDSRWSQVSDHDVVFSTVQSAARKTEFLRDLSERSQGRLFVVIDEAHHASSPSYRRVLALLKEQAGHRVLGLSATPVRTDEDDLKRMWREFESIIYQVDKGRLIESGILARPAPETVETRVDFEREFTNRDYEHLKQFGDLGAEVLARLGKHAGRNDLIVKHYLKNRARYGKTIVFAADIAHSRTLAHEFEQQGASVGLTADYVDSARGDSAEVMEKFQGRPEPEVLVNVEMLTEGFDAPKTQTVFIVRPTQSEALLSQMVGRALRGLKAGGTEIAYLVTFVDTWKLFHPFDTEYVVNASEVGELPMLGPSAPRHLIAISHQLVLEAYKLLKSNVKGDFVGVYQCLPQSWRVWEREFESGEVQTRSVLVFDNQVMGYAQLEAEYHDSSKIPAEVTEALARDLVRRYFGECQDPLPKWQHVKDLLEAKRDDLGVKSYTFEQKEKFDPERLARQFYDQNAGPRDIQERLRTIYESDDICRAVYPEFKTFFDEVNAQQGNMLPAEPRRPSRFQDAIPESLRSWPEGKTGYSLAKILEEVLAQKKHFPKDPPKIASICYSRRDQNAWGFYRYSDQSIVIHKILNSPDVPLLNLESLLYHEALHADMPNSGHNREFRERERRFIPSEAARADAERRGMKPTSGDAAWFVLGEQFLDTFQAKFLPGQKVTM